MGHSNSIYLYVTVASHSWYPEHGHGAEKARGWSGKVLERVMCHHGVEAMD